MVGKTGTFAYRQQVTLIVSSGPKHKKHERAGSTRSTDASAAGGHRARSERGARDAGSVGPMGELTYPEPELSDGVIRLRPWNDDDIEFVVQACQDERLSRYSPSIAFPYVQADARDWFASHEPMRLRARASTSRWSMRSLASRLVRSRWSISAGASCERRPATGLPPKPADTVTRAGPYG